MKRVFLVLALGSVLATAAEWLNRGGDPQHSGWQRREKFLNVGNVKELKLLWKKQLEGESKARNALSAPVMLGNIITHRGIKELVFVAGASDNFYAVDADLGRIFWKRHFDSGAAPKPQCAAGLTAAPAITYVQTNEADDWSTPIRPIYVLASDGNLYAIRPSDGEDMAPASKFIPPNSIAGDLNLVANILYTTTSGGCGAAPDGLWATKVGGGERKTNFFGATPTPGVSAGSDGTVYSSAGNTLLALTPEHLKLKERIDVGTSLHSPPMVYEWKGREQIVAAGKQRLLLVDSNQKLHVAREARGEFTGALGTWEDASGKRWIYAATSSGIQAYDAELSPLWKTNDRPAPVSLVVANGLLFALANEKSRAVLYALDAATGKELYSSGDQVSSSQNASGLAVANGHACFGTSDGTLYCFGLPMEI